jgi:hypothetical protein
MTQLGQIATSLHLVDTTEWLSPNWWCFRNKAKAKQALRSAHSKPEEEDEDARLVGELHGLGQMHPGSLNIFASWRHKQ